MKKDVDLRCRINSETKEQFQTLCKQKAINGSELIRQYIEKWVDENKEDALNVQFGKK